MSQQFSEVLEIWTKEFIRAVEMLTGEKVKVSFSRGGSEISAQEISERTWWKQTLRSERSFAIWAGAAPAVWNGLSGDPAAQKTFFEVLRQVNQGTAAALSAVCDDGLFDSPVPVQLQWGQLKVEFRGVNIGVVLIGLERAATPGILSRLLDLQLPVSILLGRARISIREALKLMPGSVIELDRKVGDYVEIMVHGTIVAKGEIVSVKGNYAVRIKQVVSREERLALRDAA